MKIGFDIGPLTRSRTGVGNYTYYLLKHLVELASEDRIEGFAATTRELSLPKPIPFRKVPVPTRMMYAIWKNFGMPAVESFLPGIDVFHATNFYLPPTRTAKAVLTIHDLAFLAVPDLCSPKVVRPFSGGIRGFAKRADSILAVSESTRRDIVHHLHVAPEKVRVTYEAVDESLEPQSRDRAAEELARRYGIRQPFLLFVSTLEPRKNVIGLLNIYQRIADCTPHSLVLIGGLGWNSDAFLRELSRLQLESRVIRPGFIPFADLALFYSAADAFVFPSYYEGFGLPVLEAMHCGCPVAASDNSSIPEVTGDAALLCKADDHDRFAANVLKILEDDGVRRHMMEAGRLQAAKFSWRTCAEQTLAVYRELAS